MEVRITLRPDSHQTLLSHVPEGSTAYRALQNAHLILGYVNKQPREYDVDCDEQVAQSLLKYAAEHCPDAVRDIEFGIRVAGRIRKSPHRGFFSR
jgi:hypothetical protein